MSQKWEDARCESCASKIDVNAFRDRLSRIEFGISGLCQSCQDVMFALDEEEREKDMTDDRVIGTFGEDVE